MSKSLVELISKIFPSGVRAFSSSARPPVTRVIPRSMNTKQDVLFIGQGHMGYPMVQSFSNSPTLNLSVAEKKPVDPKYQVQLVDYYYNPEGVVAKDSRKKFDAIILAVAPAYADEALAPYAPFLKKDGLFISILAGVPMDRFAKHFPERTAIFRAMPNLGATVGKSMTGVIGNDYATSKHSDLVTHMMNLIGEITWLREESMMDAVTAVSGSGPGYLFEVARVFVEAAQELGFPEETAIQLVSQTMAGTADLVSNLNGTGKTLKELRDSVATPGGTTEAGLKQLMKGGYLEAVFKDTVNAAYDQSKLLGKKKEISPAESTKVDSAISINKSSSQDHDRGGRK